MLINDAFAQAASSTQAGADWLSLLPMIGILIIFYLLLIRPQAKRAKEQKQMVEALQRTMVRLISPSWLGRQRNQPLSRSQKEKMVIP